MQMDPLSIAGLTIAVFDQLWKFGEATAELLSTYKAFDYVSVTMDVTNEYLQSRVKN